MDVSYLTRSNNLQDLSHPLIATFLYYMMTSSNETFPRYWPFVRGIHRSPVNSPHKGQWCGALVFLSAPESKLGKAVDLERYRAHYNVTVMRFAIAWTHGRIFNWWFIHVYWEETLQTWNNKGTSSDNTRQINSVDWMWVKKLPCVYDISPISRIL